MSIIIANEHVLVRLIQCAILFVLDLFYKLFFCNKTNVTVAVC